VASLVAVLVYLHTRVVQVVYVPTGSMEPTIRPHDRLLAYIGAYDKTPPRRGDIVAFWSQGEDTFLVKRVIAIAGDEIFVGGGVVVRNGERLQEPYVAAPMVRELPVGGLLEEGELWVMGDNRNHSEDSRDYGPIHLQQVKGRIFFRIFPPDRAGRVR
jgi:signal peptidase I